jgi:high-affinity nickel-transport protein
VQAFTVAGRGSSRRTAGRVARARAALTPGEWRRVGLMAGAILLLHVIGFGILALVIVPAHLRLGSAGTFAFGTGLTAYTLGMRHAFDADHISAIDNTTRKLMGDGRRPLSVGFFFSLGHSTVVFALAFLLAVGVRSLGGAVKDSSSSLHNATSVIGTSVSGVFLYVIAALNIVVLLGIVRILRDVRQGRYDEHELERQLASRGVMNRVLGRFARAVRQPWQMYPVGLLFGLGFDTASEVALLVLAAGAGAAGMPWYAILCLPVLFAAGMSLLDTIDGSFMNFAYGWAFSKPVRKIYYNLAVTWMSIAIALFVGTIELVGLLTEHLGITGSIARWFQNFNLGSAGFVIVGLFVFTWVAALAIWRFGHIEERWTRGLDTGSADVANDRA